LRPLPCGECGQAAYGVTICVIVDLLAVVAIEDLLGLVVVAVAVFAWRAAGGITVHIVAMRIVLAPPVVALSPLLPLTISLVLSSWWMLPLHALFSLLPPPEATPISLTLSANVVDVAVVFLLHYLLLTILVTIPAVVASALSTADHHTAVAAPPHSPATQYLKTKSLRHGHIARVWFDDTLDLNVLKHDGGRSGWRPSLSGNVTAWSE